MVTLTCVCISFSKKIIQNIHKRLHTGAPCAIIGKDDSIQEILIQSGFHLLGSAQVPQRNFVLPNSKKKKKNQGEEMNRSNCYIVLATAL